MRYTIYKNSLEWSDVDGSFDDAVRVARSAVAGDPDNGLWALADEQGECCWQAGSIGSLSKDPAKMRSFLVACPETAHHEDYLCESPEEAVKLYLAGYCTTNGHGNVAKGELYSTLNVWSGKYRHSLELKHDVIADGKGGVQ